MKIIHLIAVALLSAVLVVACHPPPAATVREEPSVGAYRPPTIRLKWRGTNLSGAEFGAKQPGTFGVDYTYPRPADVDYFVAAGMNYLRVPFTHERLQRTAGGELDDAEWTRLSALVTYATSKGLVVTIEPHNSARYYGRIVTAAEFGDLWSRVAGRLKDNALVSLNLTNEPHDMSTEVWVALANAGLREIRRVGFKGLVMVPGNGWTGGAHWGSSWYGTSNAVAMLKVVDPAANMVFEVHQYLDADAGGGGKECVSVDVGVQRLAGFVAWLRANKRVGFLGELGAPNTPTCKEAVRRTLAYVEEQYDLWLGWAWWSAGPWWGRDYQLSIQPLDGADRPQMAWLKPFLPCATR